MNILYDLRIVIPVMEGGGGGCLWIMYLEVTYHIEQKMLHLKMPISSSYLRWYYTPDQCCYCLCIFLKNYNTLVTSKICFL